MIHPGQAEGPLTGGCLSLVTALIGTPWAPHTRGAGLVLEDRKVRPYQLDRMLTQLRSFGFVFNRTDSASVNLQFRKVSFQTPGKIITCRMKGMLLPLG